MLGCVATLASARAATAQSQPPPAAPPSGTGASPSGTGVPSALAPSPLLGDHPSSAPHAQTLEPTPPSASEPPPTMPYDEDAVRRRLNDPFGRGSVRLTLLVGTATTRDDTYFILGGGLGYFVLDGLELGVDYDAWLFGDPFMQRVSPEIRYVFHQVPVVKPYAGFFYRHTFVKNYDDFDYLGGRLGVFIAPEKSRVYFGAGAVYEHMLSCSSDAFIDCDQWYPEVTIGVMF